MSPDDRPLVDAASPVGAVSDRGRDCAVYWPPRPSTVVAALIVGSSLIWMNLVEQEFARYLSDRYGWPFADRVTTFKSSALSRGLYAAALGADLLISAAMLASTCALTQIAACLLVPTPRLTVGHLGSVVVMSALFLAGCQLKDNFLDHFFCAGFCYGLASLVVLVFCLLLRLELPRREHADRIP